MSWNGIYMCVIFTSNNYTHVLQEGHRERCAALLNSQNMLYILFSAVLEKISGQSVEKRNTFVLKTNFRTQCLAFHQDFPPSSNIVINRHIHSQLLFVPENILASFTCDSLFISLLLSGPVVACSGRSHGNKQPAGHRA